MFSTVSPLHLLFFFLSIARYTPSDFWMESLVMKETKFWMSDSLLDINLSMVCFLIMDLVNCLAWSAIKELGQGGVCFLWISQKSQSTLSVLSKITFPCIWTMIQTIWRWYTVKHTWNGQPFGHRLCGCGDDLVFGDQLVHQSNL